METNVSKYRTPATPEVMTIMALLWAIACYILVSTDGRALLNLVRFSNTAFALIGTGPPPLVPVMLGGMVLLIIGVIAASKLDRLFIFAVAVSFTLASVSLASVRAPHFAIKYFMLAYLACFGSLFVLHNIWKLNDPLQRLMLAYLIWMAFVTLNTGIYLNNLWYVGMQTAVFTGIGLAWASRLNTYEKLMQFNTWLAYAGMAITCFHLASPLLVSPVFEGGRFVSAFDRATGFAVSYTPLVIAIFWLSLADHRILMRRIAGAFAIVGVCLLLLSGTRNAMGTMIGAVIVLAIVFRARIAAYGLVAMIIALILNIMFFDDDVIEYIVNRLTGGAGGLEQSRLGVWTAFFQAALENPFLGYGPDGNLRALSGEFYADLNALYGVRARGRSVHNSLLGTWIRFGLPAVAMLLAMFVIGIRRGAKAIMSTRVRSEDKVALALPLTLLTAMILSGLFEDNLIGRGTIMNVTFCVTLGIFAVYRPGRTEHESKVAAAGHSFA